MSYSYVTYGPQNVLGVGSAITGPPARYRAIRSHWLGPNPGLGPNPASNPTGNLAYYAPGTIIAEGIDVPVGWVPTLAVDPLDSWAAAKYWAAGPRDLARGASNDLGMVEINFPPEGMLQSRPVTYWIQIPGFTSRTSFSYVNYGPLNILGGNHLSVQGPNVWKLTGLGANLPARGP